MLSNKKRLTWKEINKLIKETYGSCHEIRWRVMHCEPYLKLLKKAKKHGQQENTKQYYLIPPLLGGTEKIWLTETEHVEQLRIWRKLFPTWARFYQKNLSDAYRYYKLRMDELKAHPEYCKIIKIGLSRKKERVPGYDLHHIVPKCLGGFDIPENTVLLSHQEHIMCHEILCQIYPNENGLQYCFDLMTNKPQKIFDRLQADAYKSVSLDDLRQLLREYEHTVWLYNKECDTTKNVILGQMKRFERVVKANVKSNNSVYEMWWLFLGLPVFFVMFAPIFIVVIIVLGLSKLIDSYRA